MSKIKRNFLVGLISIMVGLIYFIPYIRFSFYDQFVAAFQLTNFEFGNLGSIYGLVSLFCYPVGGVLADKFSSRVMLAASFFASMALTFWEASFPDYTSLVIISALFAVFNAGTMWPLILNCCEASEMRTNRVKSLEQARLYAALSAPLPALSFWDC